MLKVLMSFDPTPVTVTVAAPLAVSELTSKVPAVTCAPPEIKTVAELPKPAMCSVLLGKLPVAPLLNVTVAAPVEPNVGLCDAATEKVEPAPVTWRVPLVPSLAMSKSPAIVASAPFSTANVEKPVIEFTRRERCS